MSFKKGDIVVVLNDQSDGGDIVFLKAGELCKVLRIDDIMIRLKSLKPSYKHGEWWTEVSNVNYALEIFQVLS
jgi:hypothetical protein